MSKVFIIEGDRGAPAAALLVEHRGWGDRNGATLFTEEQLDQVDLPIGGRFAELAYSQLAETEKKR